MIELQKIINVKDKIVYVYKTVRENSTLVPGIFSVKDTAAALKNDKKNIR